MIYPVTIIQISDMHLFANAAGKLLGVKTDESLQAVIDLIKHESHIDLILLSGDLAQDSTAEAYKRLGEKISLLNIPTYWFAGNHDDMNILKRVYPLKMVRNDKILLLGKWQIILLNSQKKGAVEGNLDDTELGFLQNSLNLHPDKYAIVAFHHHPLPVGSTWLDKLGLENADAFWKIIQAHSNVRTILFGHVHQEFEFTHNQIPCIAAPSTCIQFKRNETNFRLENLPPGYRKIQLFEDGRIESVIKRVPGYVGYFDSHAKGY